FPLVVQPLFYCSLLLSFFHLLSNALPRWYAFNFLRSIAFAFRRAISSRSSSSRLCRSLRCCRSIAYSFFLIRLITGNTGKFSWSNSALNISLKPAVRYSLTCLRSIGVHCYIIALKLLV